MARKKNNPMGVLGHKDPNCKCGYCVARRRKTQALPFSARTGGETLDKIGAQARKPIGPILEVEDGSLIVAPHTNTSRGRVEQWLAMRYTDPDITVTEAAKVMGISRQQLSFHINKGVRQGWLKFDDPFSRIEHEIIPKALDNLASMLEAGHEGATLETVKGTIFKTYQESKSGGQAPTVALALKVEMVPVPGVDPTKLTGNVVGEGKGVIDVEPVQDENDAI